MADGSRTAVYAALAGNAAIAVLKGVVAVLTGSSAMLAEMFHSIADTGNQGLLLLGMRLSKRAPDQEHPFGHGMNAYFWGLVVSMMLFTVGGGFSIWEAVRTFLHGEHSGEDFSWAYAVLAGSAVFEGASFVFAVRSVRRQMDPGESFGKFWRDSRDPALMTVLLEDGAALMSLGFAAAGLVLTQVTRNVLWDGVASAAIGIVLLAVAVALAYENHSMLIGQSAPRDVEQRVRGIVNQHGATVERLIFLHTMQLGPHAILLALGARFSRHLTAPEIERAVEGLHHAIDEGLGSDTTPRLILIEPASDRPVQ
jgi:cation diffusion facilitator family transporter